MNLLKIKGFALVYLIGGTYEELLETFNPL